MMPLSFAPGNSLSFEGTLFFTGGSGSATIDGDGIDSTQAVEATPLIFDIEEVSRPVAVDLRPDGNILQVSITYDVNGLLDADHASWEVIRENSFANIEFITDGDIVGVQVRRTVDNGGNSEVRVYAPFRGPEYSPVYDPNYDVAFADLSDAQRFMRQAGFGEFPGEAQAIITSGDKAGEVFDAWYDGDIGLSPVAFPFPGVAEGAATSDNTARRSFGQTMKYRSLIFRSGSASFRNRLVTAWQKQLAIGPTLSQTSSQPQEALYNATLALLDGTLLDYLRWLAYSKWPNGFLDNVNNKGRDTFGGSDVEPNQNFVREKLQLFTLGQWKLNLDGSFQLDGNGNRIPTYEYLDVLNMARLYSGLNLSGSTEMLVATAFDHYRGAVDMPTAGITRSAYGGLPPVGTKFVLGDNIYGKIEEVCQWILAQDTFLVYFAKNFIHELVTENPTPQYVRRVVAALLDNGSGVRGSIRAMLRAILLDPEARGSAASKNALTFGRALDVHLASAAVWRAAEQRNLAEHSYAITVGLTNGSVTMTMSAGDNARIESAEPWRISGPGLSGSATAQWASSTTMNLNTAYTGTTGSHVVTFLRPANISLFEGTDGTGAVDGLGGGNNGVGRIPAEWGVPATVFADYPFDFEIAPGFLGRAASAWSASSVLAMWQTLARFSIYHSKNGTYGAVSPRRMGVWDLDYMIAGSPTNTQLVDRAETVLLHGRTLPAPAKAKLAELLDDIMSDSAYGSPDSATKLDRRASLILGLVQMMPQAMEQV
jgi:hypothetical protein